MSAGPEEPAGSFRLVPADSCYWGSSCLEYGQQVTPATLQSQDKESEEPKPTPLLLMVVYSNLNSNADHLLACLYFSVTRGKLAQFLPENTKFARVCGGQETAK